MVERFTCNFELHTSYQCEIKINTIIIHVKLGSYADLDIHNRVCVTNNKELSIIHFEIGEKPERCQSRKLASVIERAREIETTPI